MIKTFIAAAVIALTAACALEPEAVPTEVATDTAVELNDDGTPGSRSTDKPQPRETETVAAE